MVDLGGVVSFGSNSFPYWLLTLTATVALFSLIILSVGCLTSTVNTFRFF